MAQTVQRRRHQEPAQLSRLAPRPRSLGRPSHSTKLDQKRHRKRAIPTTNAVRAFAEFSLLLLESPGCARKYDMNSLGFPWILSSETRHFNELRGFQAAEILCSALLRDERSTALNTRRRPTSRQS